MPGHVRDVTAETAKRIRELGFTGVSVAGIDPYGVTREELERAASILRDGGVEIAQANARYEVLVHPDDARRADGIKALQKACECARILRANNLYVRPGSVNPAGAWTPHPENTRLRTLERLVDSLRQVASVAASEGVVLAIEGGAVSPLESAERVREVIDAVDSPSLRFNTDPVNFVGSLADAYNTTSLVHRLFDVTGHYTICAHAKDIVWEDSLTVRFKEVVIGEGIMDQITFLRRFEECCPEGWVLIEHLPDEKIPQAKRALDTAASQAGLTWKS
jgi:sugar phosphate isomerase/epimerase